MSTIPEFEQAQYDALETKYLVGFRYLAESNPDNEAMQREYPKVMQALTARGQGDLKVDSWQDVVAGLAERR